MSVGQFRRLRARMADRVLSLRPVHSVVLVMALVAGTHLLLSLLPISSHHPSQTELLTGIAYFVLSILLGFTLENVRSGQARVNELLKSVDADMLAIYQLTSVFGDSVQHRFRGLLDVHLQDQIDYFLPDWCKSEPSYIALWRATVMLQPDGTAQEVAYAARCVLATAHGLVSLGYVALVPDGLIVPHPDCPQEAEVAQHVVATSLGYVLPPGELTARWALLSMADDDRRVHSSLGATRSSV